MSLTSEPGISADELAMIEARADAASAGPWTVEEAGTYFGLMSGDHAGYVARLWMHHPVADANASFLAHTRADVPCLVAEVRRLQARVRELEAQLAERDDRSGGSDG